MIHSTWGGMVHRVPHRRKRGRAILPHSAVPVIKKLVMLKSALSHPVGGRRRRRHHGRGVWDWIKEKALPAAGNFLKEKVLPAALNIGKDLAVNFAKKKLGLGRRRRRMVSTGPRTIRGGYNTGFPLGIGYKNKFFNSRIMRPGGRRRKSHRGGSMKLYNYGGKRRTTHRRVHRGGGPISALASLFGLGRKHRVHRRRVHRGAGPISALASLFGLGRRRRARRRY